MMGRGDAGFLEKLSTAAGVLTGRPRRRAASPRPSGSPNIPAPSVSGVPVVSSGSVRVPSPAGGGRRADGKQGYDLKLELASQGDGEPENEEHLAAWVNDCYRQGLLRQRKEHPQWFLSISFLAGLQFVWYNEFSGVVDVIPRANGWEVRIPINKLKPVAEQVLAQLLSSAPRFITTPNSSSERGYIASRAWQDWFNAIWSEEQAERQLRDVALLWAICAGRGWTRILWEADQGRQRTVRVPLEPGDEDTVHSAAASEDDADLMGALGKENGGEEPLDREETVPEGKIGISCPSPFNVFTDHAASPYGPFRWLLEVSHVHRQEILDVYGAEIAPDEFESSVVPNYSRRAWYGLNRYFDASGMDATATALGRMVKGAGVYSGDDASQTVLLKEMWVAPNKRYPQGRYVVVAGNQVLRCIDNPYGRIPYVPMVWFPRPGSDQSDGLIGQLRPLQKALNQAFGRMLSTLNFHASPPWVVEDGTIVDMRAFSDRPNNVIVYKSPYGNGTGAPKREQPPQFTGNYSAVLEWIEREMENIAGIRPASQGINPEGSRSASMLQVLINQDREGRTNAVARYKESLTEMGRLIMEITRRFVTEDRVVSVIGRDGEAKTFEFTRADIDYGHDVRVSVGGFPPIAPADRVRVVESLTKSGYVDATTPQGRKLAAKILETGDLNVIFDGGDPVERLRIHTENLLMLEGEDVPVESFERHEDHAEGCAAFMRTPEARELFAKDSAAKQRFQGHLDRHINYLNVGQQPTPFMPGEQGSSAAAGPAAVGAGAAPVGAGRATMGAA